MQPVQDGVGDGGVADPGMPVLDGQLAGDDGGLAGRPVVDDLQQSARVCASSAAMPQSSSTSTSVLASCSSHLPKVPLPWRMRSSSPQPGHALVERRVAAPAGVLRQRAGQPGLAGAGRRR